MYIAEQDFTYWRHHRLPEHYGLRVPGHAGDSVSSVFLRNPTQIFPGPVIILVRKDQM